MEAFTFLLTFIGVALVFIGAAMPMSALSTVVLACGVFVLVGIIIGLTALLYKFISGE